MQHFNKSHEASSDLKLTSPSEKMPEKIDKNGAMVKVLEGGVD